MNIIDTVIKNDSLQLLRTTFDADVAIIIIDEISFATPAVISSINTRLKQIYTTDEVFANK
jgi:hypothetical protein